MTMKTTLDKDLLSRPSNLLLHQRNLIPATVLVPVLNLGVANDIIQLAAILACGPTGGHEPDRSPLEIPARVRKAGGAGAAAAEPRVVVVGVVEVPADQPLTTGLVMARSYRALLDF